MSTSPYIGNIGQRVRQCKFKYSLILLLLILTTSLMWLVPPVWKLKEGPIHILRWPKSGPQYFTVGPHEENWTRLSDVSRHVVHAIVVAEDARFYEHFGLDLREIKSSIAFNMEKKRFARGASTITQQVVKMTFLNNDKNILRKFREALGALLLERLLEKDEILNWYINLVEFGDGIFGLKAAAHHFFQTETELLTIQNGTQLAMILPSPNGWGKSLRNKELTEFGQRRYAMIISEMQKQGFITPTLKDVAMATGNFGRPILGYEAPQTEDSDPITSPLPADTFAQPSETNPEKSIRAPLGSEREASKKL